MSETLVVCGTARRRPHRGQEVLRLDVNAPAGDPARVNLNIDHLSRRMVENLPAWLTDLLEIACYVYCADQFTRRDTPQMHRLGAKWRRSFRFVVPVRELGVWRLKSVYDGLVSALSFLSEDEYRFDFVQAQTSLGLQPYLDLHGDEKAGFDPERIILFSGGLDSLAGAAEALLADGQRVALVSHQSSPLIRSKQLDLVSGLRGRAQPGQLFQVSVAVNKGAENATEFTQRVRSFLFATLGFVVARLFQKKEICFFENGVLSMNLPIAEHVLGARATRTTHPRVLHEIGQLFSLLAEEPIEVANPYFWLTKTEVVARLAKLGCQDLLPRAFSCTRVRQATRRKQHCGVCSQCVDRRLAVLAARLESHEPKEMYSIDLFDSPREPGPDLTLAVSYVLSAKRWASMTETAFLSNYGQVFRALPYLPGDINDNASKLHQLYVRHGKSIVSVCNKAIRSNATIEGALSLKETSLLAMIHYPIARQPIRDVTETEPSASQQAASGPTGLEWPIQFAMDQPRNQILLSGGVTLKGASAELFMAYIQNLSQIGTKTASPTTAAM